MTAGWAILAGGNILVQQFAIDPKITLPLGGDQQTIQAVNATEITVIEMSQKRNRRNRQTRGLMEENTAVSGDTVVGISTHDVFVRKKSARGFSGNGPPLKATE